MFFTFIYLHHNEYRLSIVYLKYDEFDESRTISTTRKRINKIN